MTTVVVGLGNIGSKIARNLTAGGSAVVLASRKLPEAQAMAAELGRQATAMEITDAVAQADIVILAIYLDAIKKFVDEHRDALTGKIVVDPSNPIGPDGKGGFVKTIPADESSGEMIAALLPSGVRLVKAFGTLGAESLGGAANRQPERAVLFYASDDLEAGEDIADLIDASGFTPVRVGGIDQSIRIEVGGDLHEFGKLGRLVSADKAEGLVKEGHH